MAIDFLNDFKFIFIFKKFKKKKDVLWPSSLWDGEYKSTLAANQKRVTYVVATTDFHSRYLNGHLPYVPTPYNHKQNVLSVSLNTK